MSELIGPETNLYGIRERYGMKSLADVGEMPTVKQQERELVIDDGKELVCGQIVELDYGGNIEGMLFTYNPNK